MTAPEGPRGTALTLGVQLIRSDVWVLASIIAAMSRPCRMPDLLSASDYVMRDDLPFDAVSYGVPRLVAAGLVTTGIDEAGLWFLPTDDAWALIVGRGGVIKAMFEVMDVVGCRPYEEEVEEEWEADRSRGRLVGLEDWHAST